MSKFQLNPTTIEGCYEIQPNVFHDKRGRFIKFYHEQEFQESGLCSHYEEKYYSVSNKRVLRGLHFQTPPNSQVKLVSCLFGNLLDVVVDLRKSSKTYGDYFSTELSSEKGNLLYVPEGLAHGFYSLTDNSIFVSLNSIKYEPASDGGINWNSIGFEWPDSNPVLSDKDKSMPALKNFTSPF